MTLSNLPKKATVSSKMNVTIERKEYNKEMLSPFNAGARTSHLKEAKRSINFDFRCNLLTWYLHPNNRRKRNNKYIIKGLLQCTDVLLSTFCIQSICTTRYHQIALRWFCSFCFLFSTKKHLVRNVTIEHKKKHHNWKDPVCRRKNNIGSRM